MGDEKKPEMVPVLCERCGLRNDHAHDCIRSLALRLQELQTEIVWLRNELAART